MDPELIEIMKNSSYGKALERNNPREITYCIKNLIVEYKTMIRNADDDDEDLEFLKHNLSLLEAV